MRARAVTVAAAAVLVACVLSPAASAAPGPGKFEQAQVGRDYTVYAPTTALALARTAFELKDCLSGGDEQVAATYGVALRPNRFIQLAESAGNCTDGADGVALVTTFTVMGATATVKGECIEGSACIKSTPAQVKQFGYTTVTLPAANGLGSTYVEVSTSGLTVAQIKRFVRGLRTVD